MIALIQIILISMGLFLLIAGARWLIDGAIGLAERFGIPPLLLGLSFVAFGSSMPEATVSVMSVWKGNVDIAIGDLIGSSTANILLVLGISALLRTCAVSKKTLYIEIPYMILVTAFFLGMGLQFGRISRGLGIGCLIGFLLYFCYLLYLVNHKQDPGISWEMNASDHSVLWDSIRAIVGLGIIFFSSDCIVDSSMVMAKSMGVTNSVLGVTFVALMTSTPELFATAIALRKNHMELALGTVIGSNLFNLLWIMGSIAVVKPMAMAENFRIDVTVAIGASVLLWLLSIRKKIFQKSGVILLALYVAYVMFRLTMN